MHVWPPLELPALWRAGPVPNGLVPCHGVLRASDSAALQVAGSSATYTYKLDANKCTDSVCIYAKDGQFQHADPGDLPVCSYSTDKQKCQICAYKVDVRTLPGLSVVIAPSIAMARKVALLR